MSQNLTKREIRDLRKKYKVKQKLPLSRLFRYVIVSIVLSTLVYWVVDSKANQRDLSLLFPVKNNSHTAQPANLSTPTLKPTIIPTPTLPAYSFFGPIPGFIANNQVETGVVFPQYGDIGYSNQDNNWMAGTSEIQQQTSAKWVEIPINLFQPSSSIPAFSPNAKVTPSVESVKEGIALAHLKGYKIYVVPLI